jgi:sec-independent protein translocase protein TatC
MAHTSPLVIILLELRRTIRTLLLTTFVLTLVIFILSPSLLDIVQSHLAEKLYFFSVAEPFLSHVKLSLFAALYGLIPWAATLFWMAVGKPFSVRRRDTVLFVVFTCLLFYAGTLFCYFVTLPLGIKFLLGFGSAELQPVISISRFVNFSTIFILAFGGIFELPLLMIFCARVGVCTRQFFERQRRVAVLVIAIIAAMLTPTPDIVNMLMMGGPLYLLYEAGIVTLMLMRIR